jgi:hypothetical protein
MTPDELTQPLLSGPMQCVEGVSGRQQRRQRWQRHSRPARYEAESVLAVEPRPPDERHQFIVGLGHATEQSTAVAAQCTGKQVDRF